jgi:hypothetical protein
MRPLVRLLGAVTVVAGLVAVLRQRAEAQAVRRGELPAASASADVPVRVSYDPVARRLAAWVPSPPATPLGRLLASAWAGPMTVIGFAVSLVAGRRPVWDPELGCFVAAGMRGPSSRLLRLVGADANTIGQVVLVTPAEPSRVLLAHEAVHARQAERLGPLLLPVYLWLGARYGYRDNPLERAARLGARRYREATARA